jgi:hypothetical protein
MSVVTIAIILIIAILIILVPRKYTPLLFFIGVCYFTIGQEIIVGPAHFYVFRILITFGIIRIIVRKEYTSLKIVTLDKAIIFWALCMIITGTLLNKNMEGFINRTGIAYDALGSYFVFRVFIQGTEDVATITKLLLILFIPIAIAMVMEQLTGRNLFSLLGGVPEFSPVREGRIRSQASFSHPILAGTIGAVTIPLAITLFWQKNSKRFAKFGLVICAVIVITSASSGPAMTTLLGLFGLFLWRYRQYLRQIIAFTLFTVLVLSLFMKAPVWFLIARIDIAGGSDAYFRAALISSAIDHLKEWWLFGTNYTRHWMATGVSWSPDHTDIVNNFIYMGVIGGLPTLISFVMVIIHAFKTIKKTLALYAQKTFNEIIVIWAIGSILFANVVTFISVRYFDQLVVFWYLNLAMIASLYSQADTSLSAESLSIRIRGKTKQAAK